MRKQYLILAIICFIIIAWAATGLTADYQAEILTPWIGTGVEGNPNRPLIGDVFKLQRWEDTTGQPAKNLPTDPNLYIVKVQCLDTELAKIKLDSRFLVLWEEEILKEDAIPGEPEVLEIETKLMLESKLKNIGIPDIQADLTESKTRIEYANKLKVWLKTRPKK